MLHDLLKSTFHHLCFPFCCILPINIQMLTFPLLRNKHPLPTLCATSSRLLSDKLPALTVSLVSSFLSWSSISLLYTRIFLLKSTLTLANPSSASLSRIKCTCFWMVPSLIRLLHCLAQSRCSVDSECADNWLLHFGLLHWEVIPLRAELLGIISVVLSESLIKNCALV